MTVSDIPTNLTGLYQYIIGTLAFVVTTLAGANAWQWKDANSVMKMRLGERDTLNKALADTNAALKDLAETAKRRNDVMDKLGELIGQISIALKLLTERLELQHVHTNKDLTKAVEVVETMAESLREVTSIIKNGLAEVRFEIKQKAD